MNLLAHTYFAERTADSLLGNLLADFVKGAAIENYPDSIRTGILLHREVDRFMDAHPVVRRSSARIISVRPILANVAMDVIYDHFLALRWEEHHGQTLREHVSWVYGVLAQCDGQVPPGFLQTAGVMIREDWLVNYANPDYMEEVLRRMSRQVRGRNNLGEAYMDFVAAYHALEEDFSEFFAEAKERFSKE